MSIGDQAQNKAQEISGKAKDVAGDVTDDHSLQAEGKADQASAKAKQTGNKAADTVSDAADDAASQVSDVADDVADQVRSGHGVLNRLSRVGFKAEYAYVGAFASIGISLASWFVSRNKTGDDKAQSDRWGIFIGHWAPTFMALGVALKLEEDN